MGSSTARFATDSIGRMARGCEMRAPPSWPSRRPWPPSVERARASLGRNPMRSALAYFALGAALGHRGMTLGPAGVDDLVEAYSIFSRIADSGNAHHFARYRALALFNATTCMQALPSRQAKSIAGDLLLRAVEAIGDEIAGGVLEAVRRSHHTLEAQSRAMPLRWWKRRPFLIPVNDQARFRVRSLKDSIEGSWEGVRRGLLDRGLSSPPQCVVQAPVVVATPTGRAIEVRCAS